MYPHINSSTSASILPGLNAKSTAKKKKERKEKKRNLDDPAPPLSIQKPLRSKIHPEASVQRRLTSIPTVRRDPHRKQTRKGIQHFFFLFLSFISRVSGARSIPVRRPLLCRVEAAHHLGRRPFSRRSGSESTSQFRTDGGGLPIVLSREKTDGAERKHGAITHLEASAAA